MSLGLFNSVGAQEVIVDNLDANTAQTGTWSTSSAPDPYLGNSVYCNSGCTFTWQPSLPGSGSYEVHAYWTEYPNRGSNVPYVIDHDGPTPTTVHVDQRTLGGRWNLLGTFPFTAGANGDVTVSSENGQASADAIRWVLAGAADNTAPTDPTGLSATAISDTEIDLTWTASTDNVAVAGYHIYQDGNYSAPVATAISTSHTVTGLAPITSYSFEVAAFDTSDNESGLSNVANATTQSTPPPPSGQELRPNLRPAEAFDVQLAANGTQLRFSTMTYNIGDGPLEIYGGAAGSGVQNVYQTVYYDDGGSDDRLAGQFVWHVEHDHVHFDNYARYTLQPVDANGGSQREGHKTSFCLLDTDLIDGSLPGSPGSAQYTSCNATTQGISVGWGDTYGWYLADQDIDVTGLTSGDYELLIEVDPHNRLLETDDTDNDSLIYINIDFSTETVTVIDEPGGPGEPPAAQVVVTDITPNSAPRNSVTNVTITGSEFAAGMPVYFENGSGPVPTVSNINVVSSTEITATVIVKKGGGRRTATWDLRVGSGLLNNAFTVTQ
jgi:chitodextrinase